MIFYTKFIYSIYFFRSENSQCLSSLLARDIAKKIFDVRNLTELPEKINEILEQLLVCYFFVVNVINDDVYLNDDNAYVELEGGVLFCCCCLYSATASSRWVLKKN